MSTSSTHLFMVDVEGTTLSTIEQEILSHPNVGAVILFTRNFKDVNQLEHLVLEIRETNPNLFIAVDHEGGFIQRFLRQGFRSLPASRVFGEVYDLNPEAGIKLARQYGEIMATDLLDCGIDLSLAPVLDLHDVSPIIAHLDRAFHKDPLIVITLASAFIEGMKEAGMPAVGKHFPGHGSVNCDSHKTMPVSNATMKEMLAKDLKPFLELIKNGLLSALMPAHITYNQIDANHPAGFSSIWLKEILRQQLHFNGLILSDCLSMTGADIGNLMTRTQTALQAGCDMLIVCHQPRNVLLELLQSIDFKQSEESAERILQFRNQMLYFTNDKKLKLHECSRIQELNENTAATQNAQFNTTKTI